MNRADAIHALRRNPRRAAIGMWLVIAISTPLFAGDPTDSTALGPTLTVGIFEEQEEAQAKAFLHDQIGEDLAVKGNLVDVLCVAPEGNKGCDAVKRAIEGGVHDTQRIAFDAVVVKPPDAEPAAITGRVGGILNGLVEGLEEAVHRPKGDTAAKKPRWLWSTLNSYKVKYPIFRGALSGTAAYFGMVDADAVQTIVRVTLASTWSTAMQALNTKYLGWLATHEWLRADRIHKAKWLRSFSKKGLSSGAYSLMLFTGDSATHLATGALLGTGGGKIAGTVAESLWTQTYWQLVIQRWMQNGIDRAPEKELYYRRNAGRASIFMSVLNVFNNNLNITGSHLGFAISAIVGTAGFAVHKRHLEDRYPAFIAWAGRLRRRRPASDDCEDTFKVMKVSKE